MQSLATNIMTLLKELKQISLKIIKLKELKPS